MKDMGPQRVILSILFLGTTLCLLATALFIKNEIRQNRPSLIVQNTNTYFGPREKLPGNSQLIRVQVLVNDDPNPQGVQIDEIAFNGQTIPLKPRDVHGFRGQASFQLKAGKYKLSWKVRRDSSSWPRLITREEEVNLDSHDLWIQISIIGETATIS